MDNLPARFLGFESKLDWVLPLNLKYNVSMDFVYGVFPDSNNPIPAMPPLSIKQSIGYEKDHLEASLEFDWHAAQNRIANFEERTDGYLLSNFYLQKELFFNVNHRISFGLENIFNIVFRNHLSRIKKSNPEPGRNFKLTYKIFM